MHICRDHISHILLPEPGELGHQIRPGRVGADGRDSPGYVDWKTTNTATIPTDLGDWAGPRAMSIHMQLALVGCV